MTDPSADEYTLLGLLADIRAAAGDPQGRLMQADLVEHIRELKVAADSAALLAQASAQVMIERDRLRAEVQSLRADAVIEWAPGRSYTAAELLRRAIRGLRLRRDRPLWPAAMNLCGVGSNVAHHLCRWAGRDPDTGQEILARPTPEKNNA